MEIEGSLGAVDEAPDLVTGIVKFNSELEVEIESTVLNFDLKGLTLSGLKW